MSVIVLFCPCNEQEKKATSWISLSLVVTDSMVRHVCFHHHLEVQDPVAKYWGCGECVLQSSECGRFPLTKIPRCGLLAQICQWEGHSQIPGMIAHHGRSTVLASSGSWLPLPGPCGVLLEPV